MRVVDKPPKSPKNRVVTVGYPQTDLYGKLRLTSTHLPELESSFRLVLYIAAAN